jgi:hypothetical protein
VVEQIMDLNQLYFDHQISLMRAEATGCGRTRIFHRIALRHRASGAAALWHWETPYTSVDQPAWRRDRASGVSLP